MATTKLEIYNSALIKMGEETIASTSASNKRARLVNEQYDKCRREVLRAHPWNFALKRAELAADASPPAFGYDNRFPVPSDLLRPWKCWNSGNDDLDPEIEKWKEENGYILTDESQLFIQYIYNCQDVTLFDAQFEEVLALRLAGDTCYAITQSRSRANDLIAAYQRWEALARSSDGQTGTPDVVLEGEWTRGRIDEDVWGS